MRIQPKTGASDLSSVQLANSKPRQVTLGRDKLALGDSAQLDQALQSSPDVRADKVAKARSLIQDASWPSDDITRQVADRLAQHLSSDSPP